MNRIGRVSELFFIGKTFCKELVKQWGQESRCKYLPTNEEVREPCEEAEFMPEKDCDEKGS